MERLKKDVLMERLQGRIRKIGEKKYSWRVIREETYQSTWRSDWWERRFLTWRDNWSSRCNRRRNTFPVPVVLQSQPRWRRSFRSSWPMSRSASEDRRGIVRTTPALSASIWLINELPLSVRKENRVPEKNCEKFFKWNYELNVFYTT